jgi:putative RNA 2'-phosphotransferase
MSAYDPIRTSKFLSLILRHQPEIVGIALDSSGWVGVDELLAACGRHGTAITRDQLDQIVASSDKQRFAFSEDRTRIRANQGHSVEVELGHKPATPPEFLYHGTATRFVDSIRKSGLLKQARHHVHLSPTHETAVKVGQRHGKPVVLNIHAAEMHARGVPFYLTPNGVWLADSVPAEFIEFPK